MDVYKCQVGQLEKRIAADTKEKEAELEALVIKLHRKTEVSFAMNLSRIISWCTQNSKEMCRFVLRIYCYYKLLLSACVIFD